MCSSWNCSCSAASVGSKTTAKIANYTMGIQVHGAPGGQLRIASTVGTEGDQPDLSGNPAAALPRCRGCHLDHSTAQLPRCELEHPTAERRRCCSVTGRDASVITLIRSSASRSPPGRRARANENGKSDDALVSPVTVSHAHLGLATFETVVSFLSHVTPDTVQGPYTDNANGT